MMKEISKAAGLSREYTNHQIRKTTATGMRKSGFTLEQIAHVTKHKNLDSLKHYMDGPTLSDKENYNEGLLRYGQKTQPPQAQPPVTAAKKKKMAEDTGNINESMQLIPSNPENSTPNSQIANTVKSVVTNQLQQAPNLFQNASFNNCNFTFNIPQ